ncbi:hypothetical protein N0V84_007417 [Fusarium piperis]|uniref:Fungal N-terminal domain-containing protein n=1 Tax=Fusarium piperis TaxID=1435070 RepID=A0A9W9BMB2_9HYPO|nr:hypothetical protein N0V84_007417 [Fusarium piperis]
MTGCVALLGNLASAGVTISNFIQGYKEVAEDFVIITRELVQLLYLTKAVKDDTTAIEEGMVEVREIAAYLLKGIETLQRLESDEQAEERLDLGGRFIMLERYLDDMTAHVDAVVGEDLREDSEAWSIQMSSENKLNNQDPEQIGQAKATVG